MGFDDESSATVAVSSIASGGSLIAVIDIVIVAESIPPFPSLMV